MLREFGYLCISDITSKVVVLTYPKFPNNGVRGNKLKFILLRLPGNRYCNNNDRKFDTSPNNRVISTQTNEIGFFLKMKLTS